MTMYSDELSANRVLNVIMAVKRLVPYQQLLDNGHSPEFIKICKRIILYLEACFKNSLKNNPKLVERGFIK